MKQKLIHSTSPDKTLSETNIAEACAELCSIDINFKKVVDLYGFPPLWARPQGFNTLIQIILEQQVSLASAKACFDRLILKLNRLTPENFLTLTDAELKLIGFSRQKIAYSRNLADVILSKTLKLELFDTLSDDEIRNELIKLKGVGIWTADIYLLMAMLRPDVMPKGDIALHSAWNKLSGKPRPTSDEFIELALNWSPFRSTAARLLWHFYLCAKRKA